MNEKEITVLEELLRANDLASMIDKWHPADQVLRGLLGLLDEVAQEYQRRFEQTVSFSPETLRAESQRNPHKVKAFLQALGISNSPEMMVMIWRILKGSRIREVKLNYSEHKSFALNVSLTGESEGYSSIDINDTTLLRHFGVAIMSGKPLFEGFYPLNVTDDCSTAPVEPSVKV